MILCCMSKAHFTADHGLAAVLVFGMFLVRLVKLTLTGVMHLKTKTETVNIHTWILYLIISQSLRRRLQFAYFVQPTV